MLVVQPGSALMRQAVCWLPSSGEYQLLHTYLDECVRVVLLHAVLSMRMAYETEHSQPAADAARSYMVYVESMYTSLLQQP